MHDAPRGVLKPAWLVWLFLSLILTSHVASIDVGRGLRGYCLFSEDDFATESENAKIAVRNCLSGTGPNDRILSFKSDDDRSVVLREVQSAKKFESICRRNDH
jgi:hypothetical protein